MNRIITIIGILFIGNHLFGKRGSSTDNAIPPADDLFSLSYLGLDHLPRGIRNNNPGNLKIGNAAWQGKIDPSVNSDGTFEQFESYIYGVRAMTKLLINYINGGFNTLEKIIHRYAPTSENNTQAYINAVANKTNFTATEILQPDFSTLQQIVIHMSFHENGRDAVSIPMFTAAWELL